MKLLTGKGEPYCRAWEKETHLARQGCDRPLISPDVCSPTGSLPWLGPPVVCSPHSTSSHSFSPPAPTPPSSSSRGCIWGPQCTPVGLPREPSPQHTWWGSSTTPNRGLAQPPEPQHRGCAMLFLILLELATALGQKKKKKSVCSYTSHYFSLYSPVIFLETRSHPPLLC